MIRTSRIIALSVLMFASVAGVSALASAKGKGEGKAKHTPEQRIEMIFKKHDANADGKLTASEVPARKWKRLSKADTNADNAVTKAELKQRMADRKAKRGEGKGKRGEGKGKRGDCDHKSAS